MLRDKDPLNISNNSRAPSNTGPQLSISGHVSKRTGQVELNTTSTLMLVIQNISLSNGSMSAFVSNLNSKLINTSSNKIKGKVYVKFNNPKCFVQLYTDKGVFSEVIDNK
ncbi:hypothetical protein [Stygiolobus caldivivus]|uniref:Uncharacterized protein n=1 Tax=Stygiolobus caldivivus TaxID=2824673 RepID=A0A8D5ZGE7_9CREN|nr:hypothetical protein [Stygiolobus caldivivus]BCU70873.1 hypothetical protein KN1_21700 [Stygiolobus caldivivus]